MQSSSTCQSQLSPLASHKRASTHFAKYILCFDTFEVRILQLNNQFGGVVVCAPAEVGSHVNTHVNRSHSCSEQSESQLSSKHSLSTWVPNCPKRDEDGLQMQPVIWLKSPLSIFLWASSVYIQVLLPLPACLHNLCAAKARCRFTVALMQKCAQEHTPWACALSS